MPVTNIANAELRSSNCLGFNSSSIGLRLYTMFFSFLPNRYTVQMYWCVGSITVCCVDPSLRAMASPDAVLVN